MSRKQADSGKGSRGKYRPSLKNKRELGLNEEVLSLKRFLQHRGGSMGTGGMYLKEVQKGTFPQGEA